MIWRDSSGAASWAPHYMTNIGHQVSTGSGTRLRAISDPLSVKSGPEIAHASLVDHVSGHCSDSTERHAEVSLASMSTIPCYFSFPVPCPVPWGFLELTSTTERHRSCGNVVHAAMMPGNAPRGGGGAPLGSLQSLAGAQPQAPMAIRRELALTRGGGTPAAVLKSWSSSPSLSFDIIIIDMRSLDYNRGAR